MSKNRFELDEERLATTDEHGNRVYLHPEDVKGPWKDRRNIVYWFLIGIYLVLPWIYISGKPALMINIFKREFSLLGFTFYGGVFQLLFVHRLIIEPKRKKGKIKNRIYGAGECPLAFLRNSNGGVIAIPNQPCIV